MFKYRNLREPGRLLAQRAPIWEDIVNNLRGREVLDNAVSVGGWIFSAFTAGELEPYEVSQRAPCL